jgi:hypothetical protein
MASPDVARHWLTMPIWLPIWLIQAVSSARLLYGLAARRGHADE